ncbi:MAG TPA: proton-conducting transporter membrane subunit [Thiobacillus sp.]|nr:proton-conducting transporter membrane subunit [Thiobacillus sp.]
MTLFFAVLTPFAGAALVALASRLGRSRAAWAAAAVTLAALLWLAPSFPLPFAGTTLIQQHDWMPALGLNLAFRLDGLSLLFAGLILGIGLLIVLYARYYLSERDSMGRFYSYLMLFMGSMLGIVLSENLIQLLVFWELTSLSSFLLISYWQHREEARQGARMALAVTGLGGFALLGGFLLLGHIVGSYALSDVFAAGDLIRGHPLYVPTLLLILLGAFTKSAQFPFHFWLPHAMAAPTPVSAYLHSATMVKAGVFLLARLYPALSGTPEWFWLVSGAGLATLLLGAYAALFKHDLKGLLAYSTISHLGLITLLFGLSTPLAAVAGVFHIINHATFKASLFMAAGIIDHEAGTRDMRRLNGLWRFMPYTATLAMVAAAAMAGVPLLNGFLSKEMFFAEAMQISAGHVGGWLLPALVTLAGALAVAYSIRFIHDVFFNGEPVDLPRTPHEPPRWMKLPVEILVVLCLVVGIAPALTVAPLLAAAAADTLQAPLPEYRLALWHGFNQALAMSLIALAGGATIYALRRPLFALHEHSLGRLDARVVYNALLDALFALSGWATRRIDTGSLQRQVFLFLAAALALGFTPWLDSGTPLAGPFRIDIGFVPVPQGPCDMATGEMARVGDNGVHLSMPAVGPIVREAHLVTQEEPAPYPSTATEELAAHYALSQSRTGLVMFREELWAPLEGGAFYGAGIGSPDRFPVLDEGWYVNMYWTPASRPPRGTRMILRRTDDPSRAVVVAAGYETGPGDLSKVGGTTEESHFYLGTQHDATLELGFAVDGSLPLGPRRCTN